MSDACAAAHTSMSADSVFLERNTSVVNMCYLKYQNGVLVNPGSSIDCSQWEFSDMCIYRFSGRVCLLRTGFADVPVCLPSPCGEADYQGIISTFFHSSSATIFCPTKSLPSPVVPAVVSTVTVILLTALLVFAFRPPREVRETAKLSKAQKRLLNLSDSGAGTNVMVSGS